MGCNHSKAKEAVPPSADPAASNGDKAKVGSPKTKSKASKNNKKSSSSGSQSSAHPAALYHHLLSGLNPSPSAKNIVVKAQTESFWKEARQLCSKDPSLASYVDPSTQGTPLHVACSLGSSQVNSGPLATAAIASIRAIIDQCPKAVGHRDKHGHVPLEGVFSGMCAERGDGAKTSLVDSFRFRTEATRILLERDPGPVLLRGSILYGIVASLPDDVEVPLGPTVEFVKLLVDMGGASAQSATAPLRGIEASNLSDPEDDDVLALLYRRFVRQFDQSERFFEGDNSRPEVVRHRQSFKNAAVNTFNVIELLLRQRGEQDAENDMLVHNAVRAGACPPDLLRYIVETNLEAVAEPDSRGNLPLHYAAGYDDVYDLSNDASPNSPCPSFKAPESHSKYVIDELLYAYPEGAGVTNADGVLPIVLAIESGKKWIGGGIRSLHEAYPHGIEQANLGEQHPLMNAMSFRSQDDESVDQSMIAEPMEGAGDKEGTIATGVDGGGGRRRKRKKRKKINKDESHDAIMFVQRPGAPIRDVVTTMWANEEDGGVQMLGCSALEVAASEAGASSGAEAIASVALLGVTTVVNAMKNHPNEPAVQEKACSALTAMAPADGVREVSFAASGAISTVVSAMQAHVSDATVQKEACQALRGIAAKGGAERATVVASVSGFTALVNSMGAHPNDVGVQSEACAAMEVLTGFPDAYLPELHEQTDALLQSAAAMFPEQCLESANAIRSRLNAADG